MPSNLGKGAGHLICLALLWILAANLVWQACASNITVKSGESIQSAIYKAAPGDTVQVQSGTYIGRIAVSKRLHLVGNDTGGSRPVIDAGGSGSPISIMAEGSTLEGFEARNSGATELDAGIKVSSRNVSIKNNFVTKCNQGIRLQNSRGCTVEGNELSGNQKGITLFQSNLNRISRNKFGQDVYGIFIWDSWGNKISDNEIWNSEKIGIYLTSSQENTISKNQLAGCGVGISLMLSPINLIFGNALYKNTDHGIYLKRSGGNVLKGNGMDGNACGFYVEGQDYSDFDNEVDSDNKVDGKPILYLVAAHDMDIGPSSKAGSVFCFMCRNMTIHDLATQGNDAGIYLYQTRDSVVENNIARDNKQYGIQLMESYGNLITCNNITRNNKSGIYIENSSLNVIKGNNVFKNTAGIMLVESSIGNAFYLNNLALNGEYNAVDEGGNLWTLGEWGNYYEDFNCTNQDGDAVCDSGRPIAGGKNGDDRPLAGPVSFEGQSLAPTASLKGNTPAEPEYKSLRGMAPAMESEARVMKASAPSSHPELANWDEYGSFAEEENRLLSLSGRGGAGAPSSHPNLADWNDLGENATREKKAIEKEENKWTFNRSTSYHKPQPKPLY